MLRPTKAHNSLSLPLSLSMTISSVKQGDVDVNGIKKVSIFILTFTPISAQGCGYCAQSQNKVRPT